MQKVLRKRVLRDLKANLLRYLALAFLIILCMYLIVSLVGAADTIIKGVDRCAKENKLEDGEFTVFVPLAEGEISKLTDQGISIEKMFYLDYLQAGSSTIRIFQNREKINLIDLDEGTLAKQKNEVVLEKRYAKEHHLSIGSQITIGDRVFQVTGIGSTPDYDAPFKDLADSSVDSKQFGIAFLNSEGYDILQAEGKSAKSEEYTYAYRLNGKLSNQELRDSIKKIDVTAEEVGDPYFKEFWDETVGKKENLEIGIQNLSDGSSDLSEVLVELSNQNGNLQGASTKLFDTYLREANNGLASYGFNQTLTEENYQNVLETIRNATDNAMLRLKMNSIKEELKELEAYRDGILEYTNGVNACSNGANELQTGMEEFKHSTNELIEESFDFDVSNLTNFLKAEDNPRVNASADDQVINKISGLVAGVIVMILFTYVISVFVIHSIEKESSVIGALYALGAKKKELMRHYLTLPVMVTLIGGTIGTVLGFSIWGVNVQMQDCYDYFSIPIIHTVYPMYLIFYGIVMPPVAAIIVNCFVIHKKLSKTALSLIRNEQRGNKRRNLNLGNMGYIGRFRVRQMFREARTGCTVLFGMLVSLVILMMGIDCYVMCKHISVENKADTKYEYMYTYKYPEKETPKNGESAFAKTLKKEIYGYNLDVTVLGIDADNSYFNASVKKGKNRVIVSSAMSQKYHLRRGDKLILTDEEENMDYAFTVEGITQYAAGLYVFMDINSMRELFGQSEDYYNVVFSDEKLDIPSGKLYAVTTKEDIEKSSDVFISMMMPMIYLLTTVSVLILCMVMYLMMKVMIDRSSLDISLIKILGYRTKEIKKLYLNGNFYMVAIGAVICIPASKKIMDTIYPVLVSNIACSMNLSFTWQLYVGIYFFIILLYLIINQLLVKKLKNMSLTEILKNRE